MAPPKRVRGTYDLFPPEIKKWQRVEEIGKKILESYGFSEIRVPIIESASLFERSVGIGTDIVEKEMFTFLDKKKRRLSLRPEGTASIVRAFIESSLSITFPITKFYYLGPMVRYDRPQKGRYRQFSQLGAEIFGSDSPEIDAELIKILTIFFEKIGLSGYKIYLNSLGCQKDKEDYQNKIKKYFEKRKNQLCSDCQRRLQFNPLRVLDCKKSSCQELLKGAPSILDYLCPSCSSHFSKLQEILKEEGIDYILFPYLVRGLDYYTRTVFEFVLSGEERQNVFVAGGRYNNLVSDLGGHETPAVGFAIGLERVIETISSLPISREGFFLAHLGDESLKKAKEIAERLREKGKKVFLFYEEKSLKSQLRLADRLNAKFVLIIGPEELEKGKIILRDLEKKEQKEVKETEFYETTDYTD